MHTPSGRRSSTWKVIQDALLSSSSWWSFSRGSGFLINFSRIRVFVSSVFEEFCARNGIKHSTSSPYRLRANEEAERFVQTFKRAIKTQNKPCVEKRLIKFLLDYRVTPHATTNVRPADLLQGRKLRTALDLVRMQIQDSVDWAQSRRVRAINQRVKLRCFTPGQEV